MQPLSAKNLALAAALLVLVSGLLRAAEPAPDPPAGQLLIASAAIGDPRFYHTVILLLRHDKDGALGIVINRPLGLRSIASLLAATGDKTGDKPGNNEGADPGVEGTIRVFWGGPVAPQLGFVVHSAEYHRGETLTVDGKLAMTATKEILRDIGHHQGPQKSFFALGYAGWGKGQLEGEIARRDWFTAPADPALVFDEARDRVWDEALARRSREL